MEFDNGTLSHINHDGESHAVADIAAITQNTSNITANATAIASKASQADLVSLQSSVTTNATNITSKASQADLNTLQSTVTANATNIAAKASQADLDSLETTVNTNGSDIATLTTRINGTISSSIAMNQSNISSLQTSVNGNAANITTNMSDIADLETTVASKASTLNELTDVSASGPSDGQALVYDSTNEQWQPGTVATSGGTAVVANPTLSGSEANLSSLTVSGTKYKIGNLVDAAFLGGTVNPSVSVTSESVSHDPINSNYSVAGLRDGYIHSSTSVRYATNNTESWNSSTTWYYIVTIDTAKVIKYVRIWPFSADFNHVITAWNLQGSNDGTTFTQIGSNQTASLSDWNTTAGSQSTTTKAEDFKEQGIRFDFGSNETSYTSFKVEVTAYTKVSGSTAVAFGLSEIEFGEKIFAVGGGASTLNELTDVSASGPSDGQALVYDSTNEQWQPGTVDSSGGIVHEEGTVDFKIVLVFDAESGSTATNQVEEPDLNDVYTAHYQRIGGRCRMTCSLPIDHASHSSDSAAFLLELVSPPSWMTFPTDASYVDQYHSSYFPTDTTIRTYKTPKFSGSVQARKMHPSSSDFANSIYEGSIYVNSSNTLSVTVYNVSSNISELNFLCDFELTNGGSSPYYRIPSLRANYAYREVTANDITSFSTTYQWETINGFGDTSITTSYTNAKVRVNMILRGDPTWGATSTIVQFEREILGVITSLNAPTVANYTATIASTGTPDVSSNSVMLAWHVTFVDELSVGSGTTVLYRPKMNGNGATGSFYLNRTEASGSNFHENTISFIEVQEIDAAPQLSAVSTTGAQAGDALVYNSSNQWITTNPLYIGQSFGTKMGQRSGAGSGSWGSSSSFIHLGYLKAEYAAPFNLPNDYDEEFGHYRQLIKFPDGTVDHMDINSSTANEITLPYDGYYFYCGSFTQRTGSTSAQHQIWALQNGAYRQVSPSHFRNDSSTTGGSLTYAWCMYFPAGVTIRVYQKGYIHRSGGSARTDRNQFNIHYIGETYGTNVYGTYYY